VGSVCSAATVSVKVYTGLLFLCVSWWHLHFMLQSKWSATRIGLCSHHQWDGECGSSIILTSLYGIDVAVITAVDRNGSQCNVNSEGEGTCRQTHLIICGVLWDLEMNIMHSSCRQVS
jgi:hypothetical protein